MSGTDLSEQSSSDSFLQYGTNSQPPVVVVVGDGRSRVRRVVKTATRHVTVVSYSSRRKNTQTHTSHHVTTVSFPQKPIERGTPTQYGITIGTEHPLSATTPLSQEGAAYVYLPQRMAPSSISSSSSNNINIPPHQQQMVYHLPPQHYATCHQPQIIHHSNLSIANRAHCGHYGHVPHHHHHLVHGHYNASMVDSESINSSVSGTADGKIGSGMVQQNMLKKNSIRGGSEILKRSRAQTAYELSQDLLDKKIELLERKYGGVCARNAAIVIQRAFRHYMMVKKFASITAMAKKAENRLNRRTISTPAEETASNTSSSLAYGNSTNEHHQDVSNSTGMLSGQSQQQQQHIPRVTIMAGTPSGLNGQTAILHSRTPPTRSLSMREKRQMENANYSTSCSRSPQSGSTVSNNNATTVCLVNASGATGASASAHPHVNLLHAAESNYYSAFNTSSGLQGGTQQGGITYYTKGYSAPHDVSFVSSGNNSTLDSSLNSSWFSTGGNSPHTPYYSAAQIYMRPKGTLQQQQSTERKKVPPEVPKRTSSITAQQQQQLQQQQLQQQQQNQQMSMRQTPPPSMIRPNGLCKTAENGSLTSVQSSGSDSSVTSAERNGSAGGGDLANNTSMTWKRGTAINSSQKFEHMSDTSYDHPQGAANTGSATGDEHAMSSHTSAAQYEQQDHQLNPAINQNYKVSETIRKRQYRVGLNLFNKKPEKGITYLIRRGFLENSPQGVARFLITRKGLSRQMIGEYLGNLQNQFNMAVLNCFALELDLSGMQVDVALRKFQAYFRMPGEAQKIERLMEVFSQRYCQCNQDIVGRLRSADTVFVLAFAIIMLNTDLHTPSLKPERRMRVEDFIKNLRGIDDCHDIDKDMLSGIYERVKANEFKPGSDHVTQVMKVQATIVGKKPNLALPHRRLVCYCRLYEIPDLNKKERPGVHQREVFLFNDMLVITKIFSKKKCSVTYTFRNSFPLCGMIVSLLDVPNYPYCIQLSQKVDGKILITFNARNEHDRCKFAEDLKESISEMDEMESLRIEAELERQKSARNRVTGSSENRDSGVADVEVCACPYQAQQPNEKSQNNIDPSSQQLKRSALSNSLLDIHEQFGNEKPQRRGSVGSLDSGMSISFQSVTNSGASRENGGAANNKLRFSLSTTSTSSSVATGVYSQSGMNVLQPHAMFAPNHTVVVAQQYAQQQHHHHHHHQQQIHQQLQQQQLEQYQQQQLQQQSQQSQPQSAAVAAAAVAAAAAATAYKAHNHAAAAIPGLARLPIREPNQSRTDEGGRSTEV